MLTVSKLATFQLSNPPPKPRPNLAIFAKHSCSNIRLFGSVFRNQATPTSNIDFICDHDPTQRTLGFPSASIEGLETLLGHTVNISFPDLLERKSIGPSIQ